MRNYRNYDVWEKAHKLVLFVYREILICFPAAEQRDLMSQMKRAAYSVPLNFVEGCGRNTDKDFAHFLDNSFGSLQELEYTGLLAHDLEYIGNEKYQRLGLIIDEVKAKLINLIKAIRKQ
ncbi:four helix bundle protein [Niabella drilacis]|uniref:Four helix bundle protein n=1 Tax=Niabella drilacis (strain DSM 25811 / CCM 8410 / CCUG 62505 / LMG 26954 / E90) TaxID=1285928 RepID=A0A1G6SCW1_NIADE|nr:four helix bundle protein [Niabella drilacis]SDD14504.1 four helix bundle protein [Niabella drilacis]